LQRLRLNQGINLRAPQYIFNITKQNHTGDGMQLDSLNKYMEENHSEAITNPFKCKGYEIWTPIDMDISANNLVSCAEVLDELDASYMIIFGTLLGAYRDNSLIPHDSDVDMAISYTEIDKLILALPALKNRGFDVVRYMENEIVSVGKNGDYVDFYLFKPHRGNIEILSCVEMYALVATDFICGNSIRFLGRDFPIPQNPEAFFLQYYGSDWRTPIKDLHASPNNSQRV